MFDVPTQFHTQNARALTHGRLQLEAGDGLLSHEVSLAVPSALTGLTAVFGMGTGVALSR